MKTKTTKLRFFPSAFAAHGRNNIYTSEQTTVSHQVNHIRDHFIIKLKIKINVYHLTTRTERTNSLSRQCPDRKMSTKIFRDAVLRPAIEPPP